MLAIISDIHSNIEALQRVLDDIQHRGIQTIHCLGDLIGYGPDPGPCLDTIMDNCDVVIMGNHDFAVLFEPTSFNTSAEQSAFWTRRQFEIEPDPELRRRRWEFLGSLEIRHNALGGLCVHASPRRPINEYIFPDDVITAPNKMAQIFDRFEERCFVGHTHVSGVFTNEPDFYPPGELTDNGYKFDPSEKCIVNPGSVGQPRDRDPRASYAIVNQDTVEFIRLEYDVEAVVSKVRAVPEINDFLGLRLIEGR